MVTWDGSLLRVVLPCSWGRASPKVRTRTAHLGAVPSTELQYRRPQP